MQVITNERGEEYVAVSDYGEATRTETGHIRISHGLLREDRVEQLSYTETVERLDRLDKAFDA